MRDKYTARDRDYNDERKYQSPKNAFDKGIDEPMTISPSGRRK